MIGARVREVRDELDMSRKTFGEKIYVSQDVINNIERGRITPTEFHIKAICEKFSVNEHWLRTGEGEMFHQPGESLDALAEANNIDELTRAVIVTLIEMPRNQREAFMSLVSNVANKVRSADQEGAQAMAIDAAITFGDFNAARAKNPQAEDRDDLLEPRTE